MSKQKSSHNRARLNVLSCSTHATQFNAIISHAHNAQRSSFHCPCKPKSVINSFVAAKGEGACRKGPIFLTVEKIVANIFLLKNFLKNAKFLAVNNDFGKILGQGQNFGHP